MARLHPQSPTLAAPSTRSAYSMAITTASVEPWLTAVCPFYVAVIVADVFGPARATQIPVVEFDVRGCPANSYSENNKRLQSEMWSPMWLTRFNAVV